MTSALFSPLPIAGLTLANRIAVAPMCQYSADDGCASDWHMTHLGMLANSGAALLVVEATHVSRKGRITHGCLGLYSDASEAALARVVNHCKRIGTAKLAVQLAHAGRKASSQRPWEGGHALASVASPDEPWETMAPSAIAFGEGWPAPREMEERDFALVQEQFVEAAGRAVRIGFDAVELHVAHGYLLHSIASPLTNKRTDRFGPARDGGWNYIYGLVRAVRAAMRAGMPLGARITGSDWAEGGLSPDDAVAFARGLKEAGLDYVDVSSGGLALGIHNPQAAGYNVPIAERLRRESGILTRAVGLITEPRQAEEIVASGRADMVALARAFLDDPHWAWRAARELGAEIARPPQYLRAGPKLWPAAAVKAA